LSARGGQPGSARPRPSTGGGRQRPGTSYETAVAIGSGGIGEVLKTWYPAYGRWVGLKYLKRDDPALVEWLPQEAGAQARLPHPDICRVHEIGTDDGGRPFIARQYVDGLPWTSPRPEAAAIGC
jgi:hypothetical protein